MSGPGGWCLVEAYRIAWVCDSGCHVSFPSIWRERPRNRCFCPERLGKEARQERQVCNGLRVRMEARNHYQEIANLQRAAVERAQGNTSLIVEAEQAAGGARLGVERRLQADRAEIRKAAREKERQTLENINQVGQYAQQGFFLAPPPRGCACSPQSTAS